MAGLLRGRGLVPFEEAQREVEDADAALLIVAAGVVMEAQQASLQALGAELGLQPEVVPELLVVRQPALAGTALGRRRQVARRSSRAASSAEPASASLVRLGARTKAQALAVFDQATKHRLAALAR